LLYQTSANLIGWTILFGMIRVRDIFDIRLGRQGHTYHDRRRNMGFKEMRIRIGNDKQSSKKKSKKAGKSTK
jgi:hypothetical protein